MSKMPKVVISKPGRSNVDLSRINRFSMAPGLLYPVQVTDIYPGDDVRLGVRGGVKTVPLLGPLLGSMKVQLDHFFIPTRLYNKTLHDDRVKFDPAKVKFPMVELSWLPFSGGLMPYGYSAGCNTSSLLHFLGVPEKFVYNDPQVPIPKRRFNAVPLLGYWDIFRSYYANTQEEKAYYMGMDPQPAEFNVKSFNLSTIDDTKTAILSHPETVPYLLGSISPAPYSSDNFHYPLGGLACRTYLSDRFTSWIESTSYSEVQSKSAVLVSANKFTMDAFRLAEKLNNMLLKTEVAGGRYSDWQRVQYGTSVRPLSEVPRFIGSVSSELVFEDIEQVGATTENDPLGTLASRGESALGNRNSRFYATEHGYLMTIMSIIPRVDYYQGTKHYLNHTTLGDLHVPELDGIGFQDLLVDSFYSGAQATDAQGVIKNPQGIGKQPAWTELMTWTDELHGEFAEEDKLMYMTLARRYNPTLTNISTYINPGEYNYIFADSSATAQNFWVQLKFNIHVKRAISKRVMPHI